MKMKWGSPNEDLQFARAEKYRTGTGSPLIHGTKVSFFGPFPAAVPSPAQPLTERRERPSSSSAAELHGSARVAKKNCGTE